MKFLSYENFLNEETVKIDKELREYVLTHMGEDRFQLKSKDFFKEFSVLPYQKELVIKLHNIHSDLISALDKMHAYDLYSCIEKAEKLPYVYGNVFTTKYSLLLVPEISSSLELDQKQSIESSTKEFFLNSFTHIGKNMKDEILSSLRDRAEILCSVIEALFYYIRKIDKDSFYDGKSSDEILEEYEESIEEASSKSNFSYDGPYNSTAGENKIDNTSVTAFWYCEKNSKKFLIQATIQPKELYVEENIGKTKGLRFSLITENEKTPLKDFGFFPLNQLTSKVKIFYDKILKK